MSHYKIWAIPARVFEFSAGLVPSYIEVEKDKAAVLKAEGPDVDEALDTLQGDDGEHVESVYRTARISAYGIDYPGELDQELVLIDNGQLMALFIEEVTSEDS